MKKIYQSPLNSILELQCALTTMEGSSGPMPTNTPGEQPTKPNPSNNSPLRW